MTVEICRLRRAWYRGFRNLHTSWAGSEARGERREEVLGSRASLIAPSRTACTLLRASETVRLSLQLAVTLRKVQNCWFSNMH